MQATTVSSGSAAAEARPPPASSGGEHATQPPAPSNAAPPAMAAAAVTQLPAEAASAEPAAHMPAVTTQPPSDQPPVATVPPPTLPVQSVAAAPANGQPATTAAPSQAAAATTQPAAAGGAAPVLGLTYEAAVERVEGFLRRLAVEHDKEGFFQEKVLTSLRGCEDYYVRIKHPMWFSRMREKLRAREYRTLHQLQADIELICSNATTFNQKQSRVYKNAQSMLKGCRKQLLIEKPMLREALAVLHPQGPEAARAEEAAEEKTLAAMLPPKKAPTKATKPPKKPPTGAAGAAQRAAAAVMAPGSILIPGAEYVHLLGMGGEIEDLLVDVAVDKDEQYSSFSDTDDEGGSRAAKQQLLEGMGQIAEAQAWQEAPPATGATAQSAAATSGRSNAWKTRRRGVEWRIRWLEHRLQELHHQQRRYETRLAKLQDAAGATSGAAEPAAQQTAQAPDGGQDGKDGPAKLRQSTPRTVQQLEGEHLLDYPFFAAQAGLRRNKQIVRDAEEFQSLEEGEDFPAVAYATLEQLERQMLGLRRQLCQPGLGPGAGRRGFAPAVPAAAATTRVKARAGAAKPSREGKASKRVRRATDNGSDFILPGVGASQGFQRVKGLKITVPQYHEHSAEELRSREAILRRVEEQEARRLASEREADAAPSSSSEDTDDEAFRRIHAVMEEQERTMYAGWSGGAQRQKRDKSKAGNGDGQEGAVVAIAGVAGGDTNGGPGISGDADAAMLSGSEDDVRVRGGRDGGRRGRGLSIAGHRGRGRSRARGRPPGPGRHSGLGRGIGAPFPGAGVSPGV